MTELGFQGNPKLNFVFFHSCYSAATDQFARALGILPMEGIGERAFIGWQNRVVIRETPSILFRSFNPYTKALWEFLGSGLSLRNAKVQAGQTVTKVGLVDVSLQLVLYGVLTDESVWFKYPDINPD
jgi:hypothetical protein